MARRVLLGRIAGAHGVRGDLRVQSFTARPEAIASYGPLGDRTGARAFRLTLHGRVRGDQLIARIEGITDRNAAETLKGTELYVDRERLPASDDAAEFYEVDLIGLRVEDRDGTLLGEVAGVADYGAGPILVVRGDAGRERLLPFTDAVVPVVDIAGGRLVADPPVEIEVRPDDAAAAGDDNGDGPAGRGDAA
jgi:16S rRNA processing protein RimM